MKIKLQTNILYEIWHQITELQNVIASSNMRQMERLQGSGKRGQNHKRSRNTGNITQETRNKIKKQLMMKKVFCETKRWDKGVVF